MSNSTLTVREVLRYSNHDLLNHLHLIQMNLDLDRIEEAKMVIKQIAEQCKTFSNANKLGVPKTIEWLQTFEWRYPAIKLTLTSNVTRELSCEWDETIEQYLEKTILHVYDTLDPFQEHSLTINVHCDEKVFWLDVKLDGAWQLKSIEMDNTNLTITTNEWTNTSWHYVLSIKE